MFKAGMLKWLRVNAMLIATILGVICGVIIGKSQFLLRSAMTIYNGFICKLWEFSGFSLRTLDLSTEVEMVLSYPGEIFTRALQMMILPLVISSLIVGKHNVACVLVVMSFTPPDIFNS